MSATTIAAPSHSSDLHAYLTSVGAAARSLIAALLAIQPRQASAAELARQQELGDRQRMQRAKYLNQMAGQFDATMPGLSAELRYFASHD